MLHALPFHTFGDLATAGLEVEVHCLSCYNKRRIDPASAELRGRPFTTTRFRCQALRNLGFAVPRRPCLQLGHIYVRPPEGARIQPRQSISHCSICCSTCVPYWEIAQAVRDRPPWSAIFDRPGAKIGCPNCRRPLKTCWSGGDGIPGTEGYKRRASAPQLPRQTRAVRVRQLRPVVPHVAESGIDLPGIDRGDAVSYSIAMVQRRVHTLWMKLYRIVAVDDDKLVDAWEVEAPSIAHIFEGGWISEHMAGKAYDDVSVFEIQPAQPSTATPQPPATTAHHEPGDIVARARGVWREITESDGDECGLMAIVRELADEVERLRAKETAEPETPTDTEPSVFPTSAEANDKPDD